MEHPLSDLYGEVVVAPTAAAVAAALTSALRELATESVEVTGRFTIAVSGGSSPIPLYRSWAEPENATALQLSSWEVFAVDDRAVPASDERSNARLVLEHLIHRAGSLAPQFFPMDGGAENLDEAALRYEALLDQSLDHNDLGQPVFDVVLCGLGDDGHTASLFPGQSSLEETKRSVIHARANVSPFDRLTLTFPVLNAARHLAVFAPGATKAGALRDTALGATPAARLHGAHQRWYVEQAALG